MSKFFLGSLIFVPDSAGILPCRSAPPDYI